MNGHARVAELLIDAGADRSILNREGHTPETFSKSREVRELIRTRGSSTDSPCHEQCRFDSAHTHQIINRNARSFVRSIDRIIQRDSSTEHGIEWNAMNIEPQSRSLSNSTGTYAPYIVDIVTLLVLRDRDHDLVVGCTANLASIANASNETAVAAAPAVPQPAEQLRTLSLSHELDGA